MIPAYIRGMARSNAERKGDTMKKVIGTIHTYKGTEYGYLKDTKCLVRAVFKMDVDPDSDDSSLYDDFDINKAGILPTDRVEVAPWIEEEGRFSFVTSDPLAADLNLTLNPNPTMTR